MKNKECDMTPESLVKVPLTEWTEMKERMIKMETMIGNLADNHLKHCAEEINWIKERLSRGRPSWTVCTIIAFLSSTTVGLLIAFLNQVGRGG
jgi:hypothetical protein